MCFALPLKVASLKKNKAKMEDGRIVNTSMVGKVKKNDWLLVKSNLAVDRLSKKEATIILDTIKQTYDELSKRH